ncbi:MAG TPA: tripartite tricarboxylate transporter substrate binding protein [Xanthobacteraceae bacterium]
MAAFAQGAGAGADVRWPERPIRMIVPLPAGAAVDVVGRLVAQRLSERLGQTIVIENRPGASGAIAAEAVAKAFADGYTLGMATSTTHVTAAILNAKLAYDPIRDFVPIALIGIVPYVLTVSPRLPAKSLSELLALARAKPKVLSYSSTGTLSLAHLAVELMSSMAGVELNHVPYRSTGQALLDLAEGRIDMTFGVVGTSLPLIRGGKVRALAVTTARRLDDLPDVPTMAEAGLPGFEASLWFAVVAPAAFPPQLTARLSREINAIVNEPAVKRALAAQAIEAETSTPGELREFIRADLEKWRAVAARAGIKPE